MYLNTLGFESSILFILACARWDGKDKEFLVSAHNLDGGNDPKCSDVLSLRSDFTCMICTRFIDYSA